MRSGLYLVIDEQDLSVFANVERDTAGIFLVAGHHAVSFGRFPGWIAQDRIIQAERFGELPVRLNVIAAGGE